MRTVRRSFACDGRVKIAFLATLAAPALMAASDNSGPPGTSHGLADRLGGDTLSAVVYAARPAAQGGDTRLRRYALQAYLRPGGSALVRVWNPARGAYAPAVERSWTLSGDRFCLDAPSPGPGRICADIHIWGQRVAGVGTAPYVMVDGELRPGDAIVPAR